MEKFFIDESVFDNLGSLTKSDILLTAPGGNYEIEQINGKKYLCLQHGEVSSSKFDIDNYYMDNSDKNVLLSLISVIEEPKQWNWENIYDYFPISKVKRWCGKYGIPAVDYEIEERFALSLNTFCVYTSGLYLTFRLWQATRNDDLEQINRYSGILFDYPEFKTKDGELLPQLLGRKKVYYSTPELKNRKGRAESLFYPWMLNRHLQNVRLKFSPSKTFYLEVETVFDLCFFHLSNMIAKGDKEGKNIRFCKGCGSWFSGHANRQHCPDCDRRTEYSRRKRNERGTK